MAAGIIACAAPTSGAEHATTFSFRGPVVVQGHVEDPRAEHRVVHRKQHRLDSLAFVPLDTWYGGMTAEPLSPAPAAPAEVAAPALTSPAQLPACRETVGSVTIIRGQPCRA